MPLRGVKTMSPLVSKKVLPKFAGGSLLIFGFAFFASLTACRQHEHSSAASFDRIARTLFKNVYPYLALQIKRDYGITEGVCVDAGAGPGYLSIELAKITNLEIYALDIDPEAIEIAKKNIAAAGLSERIKPVLANVEKMPFPDNSVDLVISRGSFIFWKNKVQAFKEVKRILKPGGVAFIGGGMGNLLPQEERARIQEIMEKEKIGPPKDLEVSFEEMAGILRQAQIGDYKITTDAGCACGLWVEFKKPASPSHVIPGDNK